MDNQNHQPKQMEANKSRNTRVHGSKGRNVFECFYVWKDDRLRHAVGMRSRNALHAPCTHASLRTKVIIGVMLSNNKRERFCTVRTYNRYRFNGTNTCTK